jgi:hypothetical protein
MFTDATTLCVHQYTTATKDGVKHHFKRHHAYLQTQLNVTVQAYRMDGGRQYGGNSLHDSARSEVDEHTRKLKDSLRAVNASSFESAKGADAVIQRLEHLLQEGKLEQLLDLPEGSGTSELDVRISDLEAPKRSRKRRSALAGRSYAVQQNLWEEHRKEQGIITGTSLEYLLDGKANSTGKTKNYLRAHGLSEVSQLAYALRLATKHLWLEKCVDLDRDVYGLVLFCPEQVCHMKLDQLPNLKERLKAHEILGDFARRNKGWFERLVERYDGIEYDAPSRVAHKLIVRS